MRGTRERDIVKMKPLNFNFIDNCVSSVKEGQVRRNAGLVLLEGRPGRLILCDERIRTSRKNDLLIVSVPTRLTQKKNIIPINSKLPTEKATSHAVLVTLTHTTT